jgi:hypothetical protein
MVCDEKLSDTMLTGELDDLPCVIYLASDHHSQSLDAIWCRNDDHLLSLQLLLRL